MLLFKSAALGNPEGVSWALFAAMLVVHRLLEGPIMPSLYLVGLLLCTVVTLTVHLHL